MPALPAKTFHGKATHEVGGQYFLVFDWIDGRVLKPEELNCTHCERIGSVLAAIPRTDFSGIGRVVKAPDERRATEWQLYLKLGQESNAIWGSLLSEHIANLQDWNTIAIESVNIPTSDMVISHGDLDRKNVMWQQERPVLIDWESAGYRHSAQDLIETAVYWAEDEAGILNQDRFYAFVGSYRKSRGIWHEDWRMALAGGFLGMLDWLAYNLKRSLGIASTDESDRRTGTAQVAETLAAIRRYADRMPEIESWLHEI